VPGMSASQPPRTVTAAVLIIGNEILSGRTKDANLPWLAERLNAIGIRVMEARVIADLPDAIIAAVNETRARFDYVFTTGGIGPTHDDITSECVARAFGLPLVLNEEARGRLLRHYPPGGLNEARLRMAHVPEGATLVDNPVSAAPGFQIGNVFVMAGIPAVMQAMFEGLRHRLAGGKPMLSRTVAAHVGEGVIARDLGALQARYEDLEIGSYPFVHQNRFGASFVIRGIDAGRIAACAEELEAIIRRLGAEPIPE
jgi:molybdenum cofactor synthesis domain-containing protein